MVQIASSKCAQGTMMKSSCSPCGSMQSHKRLRELNNSGKPPASGGSSQDCAICLGAIAVSWLLYL